MFERNLNLKKEDNTKKILRISSTTGRQPKQCGSEKAEDNIDNYVAAQNHLFENSGKLKCKTKRLETNLPEQLLSQERGNL